MSAVPGARCRGVCAVPVTVVDECALGLDDCDVNATCTDTDDSFVCACVDGYSGDGRRCVPGPDAIADISATPAVVSLSTQTIGIVALTVGGLGRIGWDIPVTSTPFPNSTVHYTSPAGPAIMAPIRLRAFGGNEENLVAAIDELRGRRDDGGVVRLTIASPLARNGTVVVRVEGVVSSLNLSVAGAETSLVGLDIQVTSMSLLADSTQDPTAFVGPGGFSQEVIGAINAQDLRYELTDIGAIPPDGPLTMTRVPNARQALTYAFRVRGLAANGSDPVQANQVVAFSAITLNAAGQEIARRNVFDAWPMSVSIFEPAEGNRLTGLRLTWAYDLAEDA